MPDALVDAGLRAALLCGLGLLCALAAPKSFRWPWLVAAVMLVVLNDAALLRGYGLFPDLFAGSRWNWTGKLLATLLTLLVAMLPMFGWKRCGITLEQSNRAGMGWVVAAVFCAGFLAAGFVLGDGPDDLDTIAFQWTMPGIEEELFYRGLLLLAFNEAFRGGWRIAGARMGWGALLSCVAFGLAHAFAYKAGDVSFDMASFLITGAPSLLLVWIRERTGSLLAPILAHNAANGAFVIF